MKFKNAAALLAQTSFDAPEQICTYLLNSQAEPQTVTYRQLMSGAAGVEKALQDAEIRPGEVVILLLNVERDLLFSFFGVVLSGAIPSIMPYLTEKLSPEHYRSSLAALFKTTRPAAVITYQEFVADVELAAASAPSVRSVLVVERLSTVADLELDGFPGISLPAEHIVLLQHSSGTTGLQKGVALSHRALLTQLDSYSRAIQLQPNDVVVSWLPLYHDMGLIAGFIMPILTRTPLVLMSPFDWVRAPYRLLQAVSNYQGTLTWLPNFAYNFSAQKIRDNQLEGVDISTWRAIINCSEPIHWKSHQIFKDRFIKYGLNPAALASSYAMAENVFAVTQGGINQPLQIDAIRADRFHSAGAALPTESETGSIHMVSSGRAIDNTQIAIFDPNGKLLPDRQVGEIAIQSNCLLTGYYNRPDLTEKAFSGPWYLTGDMGYLVNGELYVTGRKKDLIIVGGKNIYPQDLERLAEEVEGIHPGRVVAFGVYNEVTGTEDVVLLAETDEKDETRRYQISDQIRKKITNNSDIALRYVQVLDRGWLIKTSSGKISRSANKEKYLAAMTDHQD